MRMAVQKALYFFGVVVACSTIMASCSGPASADSANVGSSIGTAGTAAFVTPYQPLGACLVPYGLAAHDSAVIHCKLALPAGLSSERAVALVSTASGNASVQTWTIFATPGDPAQHAIYVDIGVHNLSAFSAGGEAAIRIAVAQRTTPAALTAGVE